MGGKTTTGNRHMTQVGARVPDETIDKIRAIMNASGARKWEVVAAAVQMLYEAGGSPQVPPRPEKAEPGSVAEWLSGK